MSGRVRPPQLFRPFSPQGALAVRFQQLPALQNALHASISDVQWVVESYALMLAALLFVGGSLGDIFGRRKVYISGVAVWTVLPNLDSKVRRCPLDESAGHSHLALDFGKARIRAQWVVETDIDQVHHCRAEFNALLQPGERLCLCCPNSHTNRQSEKQ